MLALQAVSHDLDQGWIAYTSNRAGSFDIWLYRPQDRLHVRLTRGLGAEFSVPYWSPDSRRIAFIGIGNVVHLLDTTTLTVARIDQIEPYTLLDWSPDNRSLVYVKTAESSFMIRSHIGVIPSQSLELAMSNGSLPVQSFYLRLRMPVALHSSSACGAMVKIGDKSHGIRMGRSITFGYPRTVPSHCIHSLV